MSRPQIPPKRFANSIARLYKQNGFTQIIADVYVYVHMNCFSRFSRKSSFVETKMKTLKENTSGVNKLLSIKRMSEMKKYMYEKHKKNTTKRAI